MAANFHAKLIMISVIKGEVDDYQIPYLEYLCLIFGEVSYYNPNQNNNRNTTYSSPNRWFFILSFSDKFWGEWGWNGRFTCGFSYGRYWAKAVRWYNGEINRSYLRFNTDSLVALWVHVKKKYEILRLRRSFITERKKSASFEEYIWFPR